LRVTEGLSKVRFNKRLILQKFLQISEIC
jgi:hypothetical protein